MIYQANMMRYLKKMAYSATIIFAILVIFEGGIPMAAQDFRWANAVVRPQMDDISWTDVNITLQIDENSMVLQAKNINGTNYFRVGEIADALNISPQELLFHFTARAIEDHRYLNLREIANHFGFRIFWVGTRNTIIVDTVDNRAVGEPVFRMEPLPANIVEIIGGSSFHDHAPFGLDFLTYLTISYVDFENVHRIGHMIVAEEIGQEVLDIFQEIFEYGFPIERMRLIDFYDAGDYLSMADNNSVAFNFRTIAGTNTLSRHAFGMAIDINPVQNPYIRGDIVWPAAGAEYMDRHNVRPGMIIHGDVVYHAFTSRGWTWGGNWRSPRDYHHFERR